MQGAGLRIEKVDRVVIEARTSKRLEFLTVYHDAILGWVGGDVNVDGGAPTAVAGGDRVLLRATAIPNVFDGTDRSDTVWAGVEGERSGA